MRRRAVSAAASWGACMLCRASPASAAIAVDASPECLDQAQIMRLKEALVVRGMDAVDVDARLRVEAPSCQASLELEGVPTQHLGEMKGGSPARTREVASTISLLLGEGSLLRTQMSLARARAALGAGHTAASHLAMTYGVRAQIEHALDQAAADMIIIEARGARQSASLGASREAMYVAQQVSLEAQDESGAPFVEVAGEFAPLNGDLGFLWGARAGVKVSSRWGVGAQLQANATPVQSRFVYRILEDDQTRTVRPFLSTRFAQLCGQASLFARQALHVEALVGAGAAFVRQDNEEFARQAWAPLASVGTRLSWHLGRKWHLAATLQYRRVAAIDFIGPNARALSGPGVGLGLAWGGA